MKRSDEEINLKTLAIGFALLLKRNFKFLATSLLIGVGVGVTLNFTLEKVYESSMVMESNVLSLPFSEQMISDLNRLLEDKTDSLASAKLNLSPEITAKIRRVEVESIVQDKTGLVPDQTKVHFLITAKTSDPNVFPALERGLVYYFENNSYSKVRIEHKKKYLQEMVKKVDLELHELEAFKQRLFTGEFFKNMNGNMMFDPTTVNSKTLELTKERINYLNAIELSTSVQVISGFSQTRRHNWPSLLLLTVAGLVAAFTVATVYLMVNEFVKQLSAFELSRQE